MPHTKTSPRPSITNGENVLMEAVFNEMWELAIERAKECPVEAMQWEVVTMGRSRVRLLPLHYACTRNPPIRVIQELITAAPDTLSYIDQNGRTLLHWSVDAGNVIYPGIIETILRLQPHSARERGDKYGCLPLHIACHRRSGPGQSKRLKEHEQMKILKLLLDAYPEGASSRDGHRGRLPLHIATKTGAPAKVVNVLLEACPSAAAISDNDGRLPIHYATRYSDLWEEEELHNIFASLLKCFPAGLKKTEKKSGLTPLAIACSMPSSPKNLIVNLLRHCPGAASIPDFNSALPIHAAARANAGFEEIDALLSSNTTGARECDKDGMLPLHWASMNASSDVVDRLIQAFPQGTSITEDRDNATPLHLALKNGADEDVIISLLSHYPKGARAKDTSGALPIHCACQDRANISLRSIEALIIAYPEGLNVRDYRGRKPIDYVEMIDNKDTKMILLDALASSCIDGDIDEIRPAPSLSLPLGTVSEENSFGDDMSLPLGTDRKERNFEDDMSLLLGTVTEGESVGDDLPLGTFSEILGFEDDLPLGTINEDLSFEDEMGENRPIVKSSTSKLSTVGGRFRNRVRGLKRSTFPLSRAAAAQGRDDITVSTEASYFLCRDEVGAVKVLRGC